MKTNYLVGSLRPTNRSTDKIMDANSTELPLTGAWVLLITFNQEEALGKILERVGQLEALAS